MRQNPDLHENLDPSQKNAQKSRKTHINHAKKAQMEEVEE